MLSNYDREAKVVKTDLVKKELALKSAGWERYKRKKIIVGFVRK